VFDAGSFLIAHMAKVGNSPTGKITIGGLICRIIPYCSYAGSLLITHMPDHSMSMHMIIRDGDGFALKMPGTQHTIPLPNKETTTIRNRANWKCCSFDDMDVSPHHHQSPHQSPHQIPYQIPDPTDHTTYQPTYPNPTPEAFATLQAEVHSINGMVTAMYNWHLNEYPNSFPPNPR